MQKPRIKLCRRGRAHLGEIELPMAGGSVRVQTVGWDPLTSLKRAATAALNIANDPRLAPFMPPGSLAVARTIRALSKMSPDAIKETAENTEDAATRKLAILLLKKIAEDKTEVGAELGARRRYIKSNVRRGPQSGPRKYTGPARGGRRPAPRSGYGKLNVNANRLNVAPSLNPYTEPPPEQPYDPYAQHPQGGTMIDQQAAQAWGANSFAPGAFPEADEYADEYMDAYEDRYFDGTEDDLLEYEEADDEEEPELVDESEAPPPDQSQPQAQPEKPVEQPQDGGAK